MQLVQGPLWFCSVGSVVSGPGSVPAVVALGVGVLFQPNVVGD